MPDTIRTKAQLLQIFASNGIGKITAQDARDLIVSMFAPQPEAALQTTWFIDSDNGVDTNDGLTLGTAIRTFAEFSRRIGFGLITSVVTVNLVRASGVWPTTDPPYLRLQVGNGGCVKFKGQRYAMTWPGATGNFTSVTALSRGTQTPNSVTNTALDATGFGTGTGASRRSFKHRMRLTSGANAGATAWAVKDPLTAKTQRTSPWFVLTTAGAPNTLAAPVAITPGSTDGYVVETLLELPELAVDVAGHGLVAKQVAVTFEDIQLPFSKFGAMTNNHVAVRTSGWATVYFVGCDVQHIMQTAGESAFYGCATNRSSLNGGIMSIVGCAPQGTYLANSGFLIVDGDTIRNYDDPSDVDGGELFKARAGAQVAVGFACSFDSIFGDGALVEAGGVVVNNGANLFYAGELFWGTGGVGAGLFGIRVQSGGSWIYVTKPTALGNNGNANNATILGGTSTTYASVPSINGTNHAKMVALA